MAGDDGRARLTWRQLRPISHRMVAKVEIYTKFACPYCVRAKYLLESKGVEFVEVDITGHAAKREEMMARVPDARTVPQIFIDGTAIGGSDDLFALEQSGQLDAMLSGAE